MSSVAARLARTQNRVGLSAERVTFAGAATLPLLHHGEVSTVATTDSLELVVSDVPDEFAYQALTKQLRDRGLSACIASPTRWSDADTTFELFVTPYARAGNFCRWHKSAIKERVSIEGVAVVSAPYFLAIGLDREMPLEPLLQLVALRSDLVEQLRRAPEEVRVFVGAKFRAMAYDPASLQDAAMRAFAECHDLAPNPECVLARVDAIASLVDEFDPASVLGALLSSANPPEAQTQIPRGARIFPHSKLIRFADYDAAQSVMTVGFVEDRIYRYFAVPQRVYDALCESEHPGRYLNKVVRDRFPYEEC